MQLIQETQQTEYTGFNFASGTKIQSVATNQITLTQNITKKL